MFRILFEKLSLLKQKPCLIRNTLISLWIINALLWLLVAWFVSYSKPAFIAIYALYMFQWLSLSLLLPSLFFILNIIIFFVFKKKVFKIIAASCIIFILGCVVRFFLEIILLILLLFLGTKINANDYQTIENPLNKDLEAKIYYQQGAMSISPDFWIVALQYPLQLPISIARVKGFKPPSISWKNKNILTIDQHDINIHSKHFFEKSD